MSTNFLDFKVLTYSTVRLNDEVIPSVPGLLTCKITQVPIGNRSLLINF